MIGGERDVGLVVDVLEAASTEPPIVIGGESGAIIRGVVVTELQRSRRS